MQAYKTEISSAARSSAMEPSRAAAAMGPLVLAVTFLCVSASTADTCPGESDAR